MTGDKNDSASKDNAKKEDGPVRSQAVGEVPGEDLGYDPNSIPTEKIPVDDDD
ncbi:MAG: hypothetical protein GY822_18820 [Deltaproteobacteria bacterium]|nr:hypothetical protein [Deltaproteobacteria bacterium]